MRIPLYGPRKDGWLIDDGVSGSLLQGREFGKFIDDLEAGRSNRTTSSSSRSRGLAVSTSRAATCRSSCGATRTTPASRRSSYSGVKVLDEEGVNDPATVTYDIKTTLAIEEYKLIRQRTMAGKARCFAEGKFAKGGKPPYGYKQVPFNGIDRKQGWTLAPHPDDSKSLARGFKWFIDGGATHAAKEATKAKIPTPMASKTNRKNRAADWTPTRWSPVSVQHIVRNVHAYLGETTYVFDGEPRTIKYPPLISLTTFAAVKNVRKNAP